MQLVQSPLLQRGPRLQEVARYRLRFDRGDVPASLAVEVTADANYLLFLNGIEVGRGPARHFPDTLPVERHDLSAALRPGENVLCALVRHLYLDTFSSLRGEPAFGLAGVGAGAALSTGRAGWLTSIEDGFHPFSPRVNMHLGPLENQAPRADEAGLLAWTLPDAPDDASWISARPLPNDSRRLQSASEPALQPRDVPLTPDATVCGFFQALPERRGTVYAIHAAAPDARGKLAGIAFSSPDIAPERGVHLAVRGMGAILDFGAGRTSKVFSYGPDHTAEGAFLLRGADLRAGLRLLACDAEHLVVGAEGDGGFTLAADRIEEGQLDNAFEQFRAADDGGLALREGLRAVPASPLEALGDDCLYAWHALQEERPQPSAGRFAPGMPLRRKGVVLDLGRFRYGHFRVELASDLPAQVEIGYGHETSLEGVPKVYTWDRARLPGGKTAFANLFVPRGARYLFLSTQGDVRIGEISTVEALAPLPPEALQGAFACGDETWNRIWKAGRETLRYSRLDVISSDSFREFCAWLGDTQWIARNYFYSFLSPNPARRTWQLYARGVDAEGRMPSVVPGYAFFNLPVWTWQFWTGIWEHHLHTGDLSLLEEAFPACLQTHAYYRQFKTPQGTLLEPAGWRIVDWSKIDFAGESFVLNALYRRAVLSLARIAGALGRKEEGAFLREAERLREALSHPRFDGEEEGLFRDGIVNGRPASTLSQHAQILAHDLGLWDEGKKGDLLERIFDPGRTMWTLGDASFHWAADILRDHPR